MADLSPIVSKFLIWIGGTQAPFKEVELQRWSKAFAQAAPRDQVATDTAAVIGRFVRQAMPEAYVNALCRMLYATLADARLVAEALRHAEVQAAASDALVRGLARKDPGLTLPGKSGVGLRRR